MSDETNKGEDIKSLNREMDIDQIDPEDLEDVSGGSSCSGCHGIYTPKQPLVDQE